MNDMHLKSEDYDTSSPEYQQFIAKYQSNKIKLTPDDCFTPPHVYDAVCDWACGYYGITREQIVRPFYPGGDYEHADYPDDCVVLDNPPFSGFEAIIKFYLEKNIRFLIFARGMTSLQYSKEAFRGKITVIVPGVSIRYENGAHINTAFVTNMENGYRIRTAPELGSAIKTAVEKAKPVGKAKPVRAKYRFHKQLVNIGAFSKIAVHGGTVGVRWEDSVAVRYTDGGLKIYGTGLLLAERAAEEVAAAEKAAEEVATTRVELSDRELEICRKLTTGEYFA